MIPQHKSKDDDVAYIVACPVFHEGGKGWFLWMIVACYLGRVTNLLALLWLIYGPSLRAALYNLISTFVHTTAVHCVI